jgi:IS4 transposase
VLSVASASGEQPARRFGLLGVRQRQCGNHRQCSGEVFARSARAARVRRVGATLNATKRRAAKTSTKKVKKPDPRSLRAAHFVIVFTTLPQSLLAARDVRQLYRYRWQIELVFKRLKQLLKLGRLLPVVAHR